MISYTDHSVRDLPQRAVINDDVITVISKVGRQVVGKYTLWIGEWQTANEFVNPNYSRLKVVEKYTQHYDDEPGGFCQAARIRDSQVMAINRVMEMRACQAY